MRFAAVTTTLAGATVIALGAAACGAAEPAAVANGPGQSASVQPGGMTGGDAMSTDHPLSFQSVTTEGEPFDAAELAGRDVVLWFWAPWCTICRSEASSVVAAAAEAAGIVEVVGVASSGTVEEMRAFVDETGSGSMPHVADVPGDVWRDFGVVAQPTFVFVDDDGRTQTFAGALSQAALLDAIDQLADA